MPKSHIWAVFYADLAYRLRIVQSIYETWGLRVRAMRRAQSLTQSGLAAKTGIPDLSQVTISRIEKGRRAPSLEQGLALARVLGLPAEVLFTAENPPEKELAA